MFLLSLPMRGAWIEIIQFCSKWNGKVCRSPCGGRGLKWGRIVRVRADSLSLPMRGAWIEMATWTLLDIGATVAPHAGGVD